MSIAKSEIARQLGFICFQLVEMFGLIHHHTADFLPQPIVGEIGRTKLFVDFSNVLMLNNHYICFAKLIDNTFWRMTFRGRVQISCH